MSNDDNRARAVEHCLRIAVDMHEIDNVPIGECVQPAAARSDVGLTARHPFKPKIALRQSDVSETGETGALRLPGGRPQGGEDKGKLFYAGMPVFYSQFLLLFTFAIRFDSLLLGALLVVVSALMVSTIPFAKIPVRALATGLVIYIVVVALGLSHAL